MLPHYWWNDFGLVPGLRTEAKTLCYSSFAQVRQLQQEPTEGTQPVTHVGVQLAQLQLEAPFMYCHSRNCKQWRPEGVLFKHDKYCSDCNGAAANSLLPATRDDAGESMRSARRKNDSDPFPCIGLPPEFMASKPPTGNDPCSRMAGDYFRSPNYAVAYHYEQFQCLLCGSGQWLSMVPRDHHEMSPGHQAAMEAHRGRGAWHMTKLAKALDSHLMQEPHDPERPLAWPFRAHRGYPSYEEPKYAHEDGLLGRASSSNEAAPRDLLCIGNEILRTWKPGDKIWQCSHPGCSARLCANCPECNTPSGARLWKVFGWMRTRKPDQWWCPRHNGLNLRELVASHDNADVCPLCWNASISYFARYNVERQCQLAKDQEEAMVPNSQELRRSRVSRLDGPKGTGDDGVPVDKLHALDTSPGVPGGVCRLTHEDPCSRCGYDHERACVIRFPSNGSTWPSDRDSRLTRMTENEIKRSVQNVDKAARKAEFRLFNDLEAQRSLRRKLGTNHFVDDQGRSGDDLPLTMIARVCADPKCRNVLPHNWPTTCHPCGSYVVMADVGPNGWPQLPGCPSRPNLAALDVSHASLSKPLEAALDLIQDLHDNYLEHVKKCEFGV